jgi:hypothetical protein
VPTKTRAAASTDTQVALDGSPVLARTFEPPAVAEAMLTEGSTELGLLTVVESAPVTAVVDDVVGAPVVLVGDVGVVVAVLPADPAMVNADENSLGAVKSF